MNVKTRVKAGQNVQYAPPGPGDDHCRTAYWQLTSNPRDGNLQRQFCDCCARDPYCLY